MSELPIYRTDFTDLDADAKFPVEAIPNEAFRNGIVVRMPNHLGDAVMALPALRSLRSILPPYCALYVITPAALRQLYPAIEGVDGVVVLEKPHRLWNFETLNDLRMLRLGVGVLFNNSFRDALMMRLAGVKHLYGAAKRGRSLLLTRAFDFPPRRDRELARAHLAKRYLAITAALGAVPPEPLMPKIDLANLLLDPTDLCCALSRHPLHLVLAAGAAYGAAKRWPEENFRTVAAYWIRHGGVVSVVGAAAERETGDAVLAGLPPEKCFNLCGKTTLNKLMVLLKNAALCVANDSGVMHLAAALGTPGVAVFGPTDPAATAPVTDKWLLLYRRIECAPCFRRECPDNRCIRAITPRQALEAVRRQCRRFSLRLQPKRAH